MWHKSFSTETFSSTTVRKSLSEYDVKCKNAGTQKFLNKSYRNSPLVRWRKMLEEPGHFRNTVFFHRRRTILWHNFGFRPKNTRLKCQKNFEWQAISNFCGCNQLRWQQNIHKVTEQHEQLLILKEIGSVFNRSMPQSRKQKNLFFSKKNVLGWPEYSLDLYSAKKCPGFCEKKHCRNKRSCVKN